MTSSCQVHWYFCSFILLGSRRHLAPFEAPLSSTVYSLGSQTASWSSASPSLLPKFPPLPPITDTSKESFLPSFLPIRLSILPAFPLPSHPRLYYLLVSNTYIYSSKSVCLLKTQTRYIPHLATGIILF